MLFWLATLVYFWINCVTATTVWWKMLCVLNWPVLFWFRLFVVTLCLWFTTKSHLLMKDLFAAYVLFIFMLVLCVFLGCCRFSVNKDLYTRKFLIRHFLSTPWLDCSVRALKPLLQFTHLQRRYCVQNVESCNFMSCISMSCYFMGRAISVRQFHVDRIGFFSWML